LKDVSFQAGIQAFAMNFGTNLLASSKLINSNILEEIRRRRVNPAIQKLHTDLDEGKMDELRQVALDPNFVKQESSYLNSGILIKKSVEIGQFDLAKELLLTGYKLSSHMLLNAISDGNTELIRNSIEGKFYSQPLTTLNFWCLLYYDYFDESRLLYANEGSLQLYVGDIDMTNDAELKRLLRDPNLSADAMISALNESLDKVASLVLNVNPSVINKDMIYAALEHSCMDFLKRIWTGAVQIKDGQAITRRAKRSVLWERLQDELQAPEDIKMLNKSLKLPIIIETLLTKGKIAEAKSVTDWPGASQEPGIISVLIKHKQQELAIDYLKTMAAEALSEDMRTAFDFGQYNLCVDMLRYKEARMALDDFKVQEKLIKLLEAGETCLQAIELISWVPIRKWHTELTKDLCNALDSLAKKSTEIAFCRAPMLFVALVAETLENLSNISVQQRNRCLSCSADFRELGKNMEIAYKDEGELQETLLQQDSRGRTVLTILSKNRFYNMLEHHDIGTIVSKLWRGPNRNYGLIGASTVYSSYYGVQGSTDTLLFLKHVDESRPYMFHYEQWIESCSQRFIAQAISTILLVIFYQMVIYTAIQNDTFMNVANDPVAVIYLRIAQVWVLGVVIEQVLHMLYSHKTKRGYEFDKWRKLDFLMFTIMIILMLELHERYMGDGKALSDVDPKLFNACLHSLMFMVIWLRFMSVLIISKRFGPYLRMIYLMVGETVNFFIIFLCLLVCTSAVFTALFNDSNPDFIDFSMSLRMLYSGALGEFDLTKFTDDKILGSILFSIYLLLANVMLLNLLVALLSNIYTNLVDRIDSEHRAVVISTYNRYNWHEDYGLLIYLPSPITYLLFILSPFVLFTCNPKEYTIKFTKILYAIYAIPQSLVFLVLSILYVPLMFIKGFDCYPRKKVQQVVPVIEDNTFLERGETKTVAADVEKADEDFLLSDDYSITRMFIWMFCGFGILFWAVFRDFYDFWRIMYNSIQAFKEESEVSKSLTVVTEKLILDLNLVMGSIKNTQVSLQELVGALIELDVDREFKSEQQINDYKALLTEYLSQFTDNTEEMTVDLQRFRRLVPERQSYTPEELERIRHMNFLRRLKGIDKYQSSIGSMVVGGFTLPKNFRSGGGLLDKQHIESVENSLHELQGKYDDLVEIQKILRGLTSEQQRLIDKLE